MDDKITLRQASQRLRKQHRMAFSAETLAYYVRGSMEPLLPAAKGDGDRWYTTEADVDAWAVARRKTKATKMQLNIRLGTLAREQLNALVHAHGNTESEIVEKAIDRMFREEKENGSV